MSLFRRRHRVSGPSAVFTCTEMLQALVNSHGDRFRQFHIDPDGRARHLSIEVDTDLRVTITQEQP